MPLNEKQEELIFCKVDPEGVGLINNYSNDAGKDLLTNVDFEIEPKSFIKGISTNVKVYLPKDTYGRIAEKSSLASKGIGILGGVIDSGYSGEVKVILFNLSNEKVVFKKGDRIAQLICEKNKIPSNLKEVNAQEFASLHLESDRQDKGFGSLK